MATRSTVHFTDNDGDTVIIYRHWDGYPAMAGYDLYRFFDKYSEGRTQTHNLPYTAAHYVAYLADKFRWNGGKKSPTALGFLSVGVCAQDPGDIEYRYTVNMESGAVTIEERHWTQDGAYWSPARPFTRHEAVREHLDLLHRARAHMRQRRQRQAAHGGR